jgi:S1-C subfamily serine protease
VDEAARGPRLEPVPVAAAAPGGSHDRDRGYGAYLGTIPDFAERKEPGVLVSAVRPASPAEKAGLAAGDVLLSLGAAKLVSLKDLGYALRAHRPGDEVEVGFRRGDEQRSVKVRLEERK